MNQFLHTYIFDSLGNGLDESILNHVEKGQGEEVIVSQNVAPCLSLFGAEEEKIWKKKREVYLSLLKRC